MAEIARSLVHDLRAHGVAVSGAGADEDHDYDDEHGVVKVEPHDEHEDDREQKCEAMREFIRAVAAEMFS